MSVGAPRAKYQGLVQILKYNRHFYALAAGAVCLASLVAFLLPGPRRWLALAGIALILFWTAASLLVSHYVYDRSSIYELRWMLPMLPAVPRKWIHIHAGLDESSAALFALLPNTEGHVVDIYDPEEMTEPSIARARANRTGPQAQAVSWHELPFPTRAYDAVFLVFAAHEIRKQSARKHFFHELARVLKPGGTVLLVEHLRDPANFLAFGPGFFHFLPRREWLYAAREAGFELARQSSITPFVHSFAFQLR